jgi:hypothetical protein
MSDSFFQPTTQVESDPSMFHENPQPAGPKPKAVRPRSETQSPTDAIVWAAYRKFARSSSAREAMNLCLAEDRAAAKRRVQP